MDGRSDRILRRMWSTHGVAKEQMYHYFMTDLNMRLQPAVILDILVSQNMNLPIVR